MNIFIQNKLDEIVDLCKQHHVRALSLFGSAAKDTMRDDSGVDLLVEFSNDIDVLEYADNYFSLLEQLQTILNRKVDLLSSKSIKNTVLKEAIDRSKINLYAA